MKLEQYIALHLAFIVCLSSLMLGMGQGDAVLPTLTLMVAIVSLWITDFKKWFFVGPILSNVLIVLILLASTGYLIRVFDESFGGSLFSIAILRVLIFFQWVLLFRKKENRTCWNIISVSFLEVIVASVFQQTAIFGLMMVLYLFAALTVVTLMHLNRDRLHFTQHVFLRSLFRASGFRRRASGKSIEHSSRSPKPEVRSPSRWPLTNEKASFSGSAANLGDMIGIGREFYHRLVVTTMMSLVVGVLIFFLTPRQDFRIDALDTQRERWRSPAAVSFLNVVGFSEEIRLGSLGTVLDNPAEVMTVRFSQLTNTASTETADETDYTVIRNRSVYFRGVALQNYTRGRWTAATEREEAKPETSYLNQPENVPVVKLFADVVDFSVDSVIVPNRLPATVPFPQDRFTLQFQPGTQLIHVNCEYYSEAQGTFFAVWPYFLPDTRTGGRFNFSQDRIVRPQNSFGRRPPVFHFLTWGFSGGNQLGLIPCQEVIDLPSLLAFDEAALPTVAQLAQQWDTTQQGNGMMARAQNLEYQLMADERFYYALGGIARSASLDPLEDFVRDHPGGHCEYFAGALAMMLRSVGIPARVIVGYRLDTEVGQQGNDRYVVRQSDAHSWVEAYIPPHEIPESLRNGPHAEWWGRGGWLRLDPTASLRDVMVQTGFWASLKFWATSFWNDYVINFNDSRQETAVYSPIAGLFAAMKERFFDANYWKTIGRAVLHRYSEIFRDLRQGNWHGSDLVLLAIPPLILLTLGFVIYRLIRGVIRGIHRQKLAREQRQRLVTIEFYRRLERILKKINLIRAPAETPREFARRSVLRLQAIGAAHEVSGRISSLLPLTSYLLPQLAEAFYRVRYGDVTLTPSETDEINTVLSQLETVVTATS